MKRFRIIFWSAMVVLVLIAVAAALTQLLRKSSSARPMPVPEGDQEIAWFHTATNAATWERFVTGAHRAVQQDPRLIIDDSRAFLDETTAAPELVLRRRDSSQKLRIRWYKQSSQMTVQDWVEALAKRDPAPLAIMGGGSSDRALELARIMAAQSQWKGSRPLLLITTATANTVFVEPEKVASRRDLMEVYPNRTFRFCFTNRQMAGAVLDFVWRTPELRPRGQPAPTLGAIGLAAAGDPLGCAALAVQRELAPEVFALEWKDDPYSVDLSEQFRDVFYLAGDDAPWTRHGRLPLQVLPISSSVGGFLRPNDSEAKAIERLLSPDPPFRPLPHTHLQRSLLMLPAVVAPARRVIAGLVGADPDLSRSLVAISGDSIAFSNVYRDADLLWNIRVVPVPLVFFTHQNPVAWDADEAPPRDVRDPFGLYPPNGTDDVLHFADVVRLVADAAWTNPVVKASDPVLLRTVSDALGDQLRRCDPPFFDADGNRLGGSGESIVYLRPESSETGLHGAMIEVWSHRDTGWQQVKRLPVRYR